MDKSHHNIPDHIKKYINPKKKETAPGQYVYQGKWVREEKRDVKCKSGIAQL